MYETRETSIKGIVVTILLIILVICVLMWIFPTKKDIKQITKSDNEIISNELYSYNLRVLQNAGRAYYYSATIPKNNGDSVKTTLSELISKKILLELKDKSGKTCDQKASYVKLTKKASNEYELEAHLKCDKEENYILTNLGCSDFKNGCPKTTTSKNTSKTTTKTNNTTTTKTSNTTNTTKTSNTASKTTYYYRYLYDCPTTKTTYSNWSSWTTSYVSSSSSRMVETKVEYEQRSVRKTKSEPVTTYETQTTYETVEETRTYVNEKPTDAKSCKTLPRSNYTLYECTFETRKEVTKKVPKTTYQTVVYYEYEQVPVTYYRYRTVSTTTSSKQIWSTDSNNSTYKKNGCSIIKSEKVAK